MARRRGDPKRVLLIGGGGREFMLAWKLSQEGYTIHWYTGNPLHCGYLDIPHCLLADPESDSVEDLIAYAKRNSIGWVLIGPEKYLAAGYVDGFKYAGIAVFGPTKAAAILETSKYECKRLLDLAGILTADWAFFDVTNPSRALDFIRDNFRKGFRVIKAVGLCDGKGVTVGKTLKEAEEAIRDCLKRDKFGAAGRQILIEKKLKPRRGLVRGEFSMTVVTDGVDYQILLAAMDHKQVFDGDKGLNGGGSGAISHPDFVTAKVKRQFENDVLKPLLATLNNLKIKFKGVLYFGLMLTDRGPEVLEINVRFGDPECQVIMGMCQQGMGELLYRVATGQSIKDIKVKFHQGRAVYLIQMAEGYPGTVRRKGFQDGDIISGLEQVRPLKDIIFVHAGTTFSEKGRAIRTNGGRVTGIFCRRTGRRARELARQRTLAVVRMVNWPGQFHRTDIGEIGCEAA